MTLMPEATKAATADIQIPDAWFVRMENCQVPRWYIDGLIAEHGTAATVLYMKAALGITDIDDEIGRPLLPG